jgi:isoleucyl-tRNA synthetase
LKKNWNYQRRYWQKITVEEYNEACKKAVMRYTDIWNDLTKKMGYWVDMDDPYITYKPNTWKVFGGC